MSMLHTPKDEFDIDTEIAEEMLQNVFHAVGQKPNSTPFDKLLLRQKTKTGSLKAARIVAIVALVGTLLMPTAFLSALRDVEKPVIVNDYMEDNLLWIALGDDDTGIDFDNSYAKTDDGRMLLPAAIDAKNNLIAFETIEESLNIYISDYAGNTMHAVYHANK